MLAGNLDDLDLTRKRGYWLPLRFEYGTASLRDGAN